MADSETPTISMADEGEAIVIQRDLPEPVAYRGKVFIGLEFVDDGGDVHDFFTDDAFVVPPDRGGRPFEDYSIEDLSVSVHTAMRAGFSDPRIFPNARPTSSTLRLIEKPNRRAQFQSADDVRVVRGLASARDVDLAANVAGVGKWQQPIHA